MHEFSFSVKVIMLRVIIFYFSSMLWLILCVQYTRLRDTQEAGRTLFLGVSVRLHLNQQGEERRSILTNVHGKFLMG
jgi:hypothetical protein